jgi:hypothetical protein
VQYKPNVRPSSWGLVTVDNEFTLLPMKKETPLKVVELAFVILRFSSCHSRGKVSSRYASDGGRFVGSPTVQTWAAVG